MKKFAYQICLLLLAAAVVIGIEYLSSLQHSPAVIEYTVHNPDPLCSNEAVSVDGTPPVLFDKWQTPCHGGYFYLKPYNAIYFKWNDQAYFVTNDVSSFRVYMQDSSQSYAHDRKNVYHQHQQVEGAEPNTFTPAGTL